MKRFAFFAALFCLAFAARSGEPETTDPMFPEPMSLEPMSLEACRAFALARSPELERQRLSYSNRVESVEIARAKYDPVLTVRRSWEDTDDPGRTTGTVRQTLPADLRAEFSARTEERNGESFQRYALQLSKTILGGGSRLESRLPIDRALIRESIQANTLSREQRRLLLTVTRRYFAVVRAKLTLGLRELQLERAKTNLEHAEVREDPLDIATAKLRIPESEQDVLRTEREIADGLLELKETMGLPLTQPMEVRTEREFAIDPIDPEKDLKRAMDEHEDIRNARLELELARKEMEVADTQTRPEVRLEASFEENDPQVGDASQARAEVVLEWPWLNRADRAEARQRALDLREREVGVFQARQEVRRRIESTALRVAEAERTVELQSERVAVLERQFELFRDRWENGEINILEFVRSQNDLENARVRLVTEQTRYFELRAEYDFVTGR